MLHTVRNASQERFTRTFCPDGRKHGLTVLGGESCYPMLRPHDRKERPTTLYTVDGPIAGGGQLGHPWVADDLDCIPGPQLPVNPPQGPHTHGRQMKDSDYDGVIRPNRAETLTGSYSSSAHFVWQRPKIVDSGISP